MTLAAAMAHAEDERASTRYSARAKAMSDAGMID
jgi:hypothetical protein